MAHGKPTRFGEIASLAYPANALLVIRFAPAMEHRFEALRRASFPGGHSMERGATIVADPQGVLSLQHIGGKASTYRNFTPDLSASPPARYKVVGPSTPILMTPGNIPTTAYPEAAEMLPR